MLVHRSGVGASAFETDDKRGRAFARGGCVTVLEAAVTLGEWGSTDEFFASYVFSVHMDAAFEDEFCCRAHGIKEIPDHGGRKAAFTSYGFCLLHSSWREEPTGGANGRLICAGR